MARRALAGYLGLVPDQLDLERAELAVKKGGPIEVVGDGLLLLAVALNLLYCWFCQGDSERWDLSRRGVLRYSRSVGHDAISHGLAGPDLRDDPIKHEVDPAVVFDLKRGEHRWRWLVSVEVWPRLKVGSRDHATRLCGWCLVVGLRPSAPSRRCTHAFDHRHDPDPA